MSRPLLYLLLLLGALAPGLILSTLTIGLAGSAVPEGRLIAWPNQIDVSIAFQAVEHMATTPWSDGLLRASTFEGGTHISMTDGWPLFALIVRLTGIASTELLRLMAVLTFPLIALSAAAVAREMGARTLPQLALAATFAILSAPVIVRFDPHPHVAQVWTILAAAAVALALPGTPRPRLVLALGTAAAITGFLLYPYLGAAALLLLLGGIVDRARTRPNGLRFLGGATISVGAAFTVVFLAGGYIDGDLSSVAGGYGMMGLNLLAPFYPVACDWCTPLPSLGPAPFWQDFNGAAFLGGGALAALVIALLRRGRTGLARAVTARPAFAAALGLGVAYAVGSHAAIGPLVLWAIEMPADFPGATIFQSLRMSAALAWPALLVAAIAAAVAAVAPSSAPRPSVRHLRSGGIAALTALLVVVQVASWSPLLERLGSEHRESAPTRPEITLLERVVATSPGGVRITPPISCRPSWRGGNLFGAEFDLAAQLGRLTGRTGISFAGAREVRVPTWGWCEVPTVAALTAQRAAGWSILYQGAIGDIVLRPSPAADCVALPGYILCPAERDAIAGDVWVSTAGLAVEPTLGLPILPAGGLVAGDPRLGAAVSASAGWWTHGFPEDPWPNQPFADAREFEAVTPLGVGAGANLALVWEVSAGTRLVVGYAPRVGSPESPRFEPRTGVIVEGATITILGRCTEEICVVDESLGLVAGRIDLRSLLIAP